MLSAKDRPGPFHEGMIHPATGIFYRSDGTVPERRHPIIVMEKELSAGDEFDMKGMQWVMI